MDKEALNRRALLVVVLFISALFLAMIRQFLMAIVLAGIFSSMAYPLYRKLRDTFRGRRHLASIITVLLIVCVVLIPLGGLIGMVASEAIKVGGAAKPWVEKQLAEPGALSGALQSVPFYENIEPYRQQILKKAGELVGSISKFILNKLSSVTLGTVNLIFTSFVMLYCMFFFFIDGRQLLDRILYYVPLKDRDERQILDKFTSVTRATIKGTLLIGLLQGGLAGLAFHVVGIPSAVFWGAIMAVLSIIPAVGSALIWVPAAIVLIATGKVAGGIGLAAFCGILVGSLDNLLRPALVGKDTQMHELMIFFGTLGGIFLFGIPGMFIGPIIAALFVTVWEIYGVAFKDVLPKVAPGDEEHPPERVEE